MTTKNERLEIRLSKEEKDRLKLKAKLRGVKLTTYVRSKLFGGVRIGRKK